MTDVYIIDDHVLVVEGITRIIDHSGKARVAGKFYDLASFRSAVEKGATGILLLDVELPDGNGVDFCAEAGRKYPNLKIVMLTGFKEFNIAKRALHNGALGYLLKNSAPEEIHAAIEAVARGEKFLCEQIDMLLEDRKDEPIVWLTNREKDIIRCIADGLTVSETAQKIDRGQDVVRHHRKKLFRKLGAKNMVDLIRRADEMKLI